MSSSGGSWRVAGRLARREVRRHPWRHLLVTGLILVPVLAALAAFSALTTWHDAEHHRTGFTYPDGATLRLNSEQMSVHDEPGDDLRTPEAARALGLPPETRTEVSWSGTDWLYGDRDRDDGQGPLLAGADVIEADPGSSATAQFVVEEGRLPRASDEIFLTEPLARSGGWSVGDETTSARSGRSFRVVGTGVLGNDIRRQSAAVTGLPDSYWTQPLVGLDAADGVDDGVDYGRSTVASQVMTAWVDDPALRQDLSGGFFVRERFSSLDRRVGPGLTMVAAGLCAVVAVVASAAFAISSRRQLRTIGLLSTVGTDPSTIRRAMLLQGAIPGLAAGTGAVILAGVSVAVANAAGLLERTSHISGAQVSISPMGSAIAIGLGLASGIAAAWQPARTASRIPTLAALAGRRPVGPVRSRVLLGGLVLWVGGAVALAVGFGTGRTGHLAQVQPFLIIGGVAAVALGGVGLAPVVVALLDPLAARFRGTWRMGLRGLARHRMQSAATVAAIGVVLAIPVGLLTTRNGLDDRDRAGSGSACCVDDRTTSTIAPRPRVDILRNPQRGAQVQVTGALRSEAATSAVNEVQQVLGTDAAVIRSLPLVDQGGAWRKVAVIDEDDARSVLEPWAADAIEAGQAVAFDGGPAKVSFTAAGETSAFEVQGRDPDIGGGYLPITATYLVGTDALDGVGAERPPDGIVVVRDTPLTAAEQSNLEALQGYTDFRTSGPKGPPTLQQVEDAAAGRAVDHGRDAIDISILSGQAAQASAREPVHDRTPRDEWNTALLVGAVVALALALLVLTITLSLRSVDGELDRRAATAAGVAPAALRHQRAFEGVVLALLGAALAIPLGWIPVMAARLGVNRGDDSLAFGEVFALPSWEAIPILLAPAIVAAVLWTAVPALAAAVRTARHRDQRDELLPRW